MKKAGRFVRLGKSAWVLRLLAAVTATTTAFAAISSIAAAAIAATAAPTTASATATTAAITAAFPLGAGSTLLARTGDVHRQRTPFQFMAVEFFHAFLGLFATSHGDEGEAAGTTGELVEDDFDDADGANLAEQGLEVLSSGGEGKIPDVEL